MFLGQFNHNIDDKGRLTVPARFRDLLAAADGAYIMQGFDHNLMVLPAPVFEEMSRKVGRLSMTDPTARMLKRLIFSTADRIEVDRAGRILIPQFLRQSASLEGEAMIVGVGDYFEMWSPTLWTNQMDQLQDAESNAQRFVALELTSG